ncbi:2-C-methyl-D-erythritol 4-phosphate cytidylyltransferase [Fournierella massiliensis]|nr:IspD/TarI family cytidylyltransferase [Fournierella massiliensis]MCF2557961.1 2-C-methyl-D-erythritol 4-phosphate cytidylyltransferase [Fournierella massiliensis]
MNVAVILAGGVGSRMNAGKPKQFIEVLGKPVLAYTVENFQRHHAIDAIEIVCVDGYIEYVWNMVKRYHLDKVKYVTKGGADFQKSVIAGIDALKPYCAPQDILLVHYGASPFVTEEIITDAIRVCKEKGNCTSASPLYLLAGTKDGDYSAHWIDRDEVMTLNAPQAFRFDYVTQLYDEAIEKNLLDKVEPHTTSLMFLMGRKIYFSKGSQTNIKITTKDDLQLLEAYAVWRKQKEEK